jgi:hypothetical protein
MALPVERGFANPAGGGCFSSGYSIRTDGVKHRRRRTANLLVFATTEKNRA